jgi:hypothetical protein
MIGVVPRGFDCVESVAFGFAEPPVAFGFAEPPVVAAIARRILMFGFAQAVASSRVETKPTRSTDTFRGR